jgi:hypothetical protein
VIWLHGCKRGGPSSLHSWGCKFLALGFTCCNRGCRRYLSNRLFSIDTRISRLIGYQTFQVCRRSTPLMCWFTVHIWDGGVRQWWCKCRRVGARKYYGPAWKQYLGDSHWLPFTLAEEPPTLLLSWLPSPSSESTSPNTLAICYLGYHCHSKEWRFPSHDTISSANLLSH